MAVIARPKVITVMSTVRTAEHRPTRFEVVVDDSVPATELLSLVISIYLKSSIIRSVTEPPSADLRMQGARGTASGPAILL